MSLIYDALRKSEEERRLGQVPTLLGHEPASWRHAREELERRRRTRWLLVPVVVAAIVGGWWYGTREPLDEPVTPAAAQRGTEAGHGEGARALAPRETPDVTAATPQVPVAAVPPAVAPDESATASPALPQTPEDVTAKQGVEPATLQKFEQGEVFANSPEQLRPVQPTTGTPVVPPEAALPAPLPEPAPEPAVSEVAPPPAQPVATTVEPVIQPIPATVPPAAPQELPATPPEPAGVPSIYDLPFATRKALPPLVLSMHVYTQDPARRFVLLDDERMVEGDRAGEVLLRQIHADGVVLEYQGTAFFVPRSGN